jgi:hypothetical protein
MMIAQIDKAHRDDMTLTFCLSRVKLRPLTLALSRESAYLCEQQTKRSCELFFGITKPTNSR